MPPPPAFLGRRAPPPCRLLLCRYIACLGPSRLCPPPLHTLTSILRIGTLSPEPCRCSRLRTAVASSPANQAVQPGLLSSTSRLMLQVAYLPLSRYPYIPTNDRRRAVYPGLERIVTRPSLPPSLSPTMAPHNRLGRPFFLFSAASWVSFFQLIQILPRNK